MLKFQHKVRTLVSDMLASRHSGPRLSSARSTAATGARP